MAKTKFNKAGWIRDAIVYEVNLRQYSPEGTLQVFRQSLPRLRDMGVDTLWFMPLTPISEKNKKGSMGSYYACRDYTSFSPEFGTLAEFKELVRCAHQLGFKVIIDWVANHTGWDHVWTVDHPGYYKRDPSTMDFQMAHGMDDIIELDYTNAAMRKDMITAMEFWVRECGIDGFRCDLAFWVEPGFWMEARTALQEIKTLFWLGEFDPLDHPEYFDAFDAAYTWTWMHKTESYCKKEDSLDTLREVTGKYDSFCSDQNIPLWFTSNHDENSWNGTEYEKYNGLAYALAVFSFTRNGMPLVYTGQELPNPKRLQFFEKDPVAWKGAFALHGFYKILSALRKSNPALHTASPAAVTRDLNPSATGDCLAFLRRSGPDEVLVILNLVGDAGNKVVLTNTNFKGLYKNVFSGTLEDLTAREIFDTEPGGYLVYEKIWA